MIRKCYCQRPAERVQGGWICGAMDGKCGFDVAGEMPSWESYHEFPSNDDLSWWKEWVRQNVTTSTIDSFIPPWQLTKREFVPPSTLPVLQPQVSHRLPQLLEESERLRGEFRDYCESHGLLSQYERWYELVFGKQTNTTDLSQGSIQWDRERAFRMTASKLGTAAGHCPYDPKGSKLLAQITNPTPFTNRAIHNGIELQDIAEAQYVARITQELALACKSVQQKLLLPKVRIIHEGLYVDPHFPWLGGSVDAIVVLEHPQTGKMLAIWQVEIKCPDGKFYVERQSSALMEGSVPQHYYDQIQGLMYMMRQRRWKPEEDVCGIPWCDFVVYIPERGLHITRHLFRMEYAETLIQKVNVFYFKQFLPRLVETL